MNDADLLEIWIMHTDAVLTILFGFFSVTSAFLGVGYLVGKSIPSGLCAIVIALYSIMAVTLTAAAQRHGVGAISVRDKLTAMGSHWHSLTTEPQAIYPTVMYAIAVMMFIVSIVSVAYFLHSRRTWASSHQ